MKPRSQVITADGFDKNVAEKMPRIRRLEESLPSHLEAEPQPLKEDHHEPILEMRSPEKPTEERVIFESPKKGIETEQSLDILQLIEDLQGQLLASAQTKRALEMDLTSYQKTIYQLTQDNQELHHQLDVLNKEHQKLQEFKSESIYLQEENADALERIREFQVELREMRETLTKAIQEREEALSQNMDLERKYEILRKSFNEVKESLTFLRDSCKKSYYSLSETPE